MSLLEVKNLSFGYGKKEVLKNISFTLEKGTMCALLGANATGKTTLIKSICALLSYDGGCLVDGMEIKNLSAKKAAELISYIPQRSSLNLPLTVREVVMMGHSSRLSIFENTSQEQEREALNQLQAVGMEQSENENFLALSEGQKQLVILARALVQNAPLMIFDEPDSALDFQNKHLIMNVIKRVLSSEKAALISFHDANFALRYCTRALLIKDGELSCDLDLSIVSRAEIQAEFSKIYGEIEIIDYKGSYYMLKV